MLRTSHFEKRQVWHILWMCKLSNTQVHHKSVMAVLVVSNNIRT